MTQPSDALEQTTQSRLISGDLTVDVVEMRADIAGSELTLSPKAHALLVTLMRHRGGLVRKDAQTQDCHSFSTDVCRQFLTLFPVRLARLGSRY
ncbi:MAG: hypothetical protein AAFO63_03595 [Pseudomonadota bacterium]